MNLNCFPIAFAPGFGKRDLLFTGENKSVPDSLVANVEELQKILDLYKNEKSRLTVRGPAAYIPLTNEGGTAAHGRLLRPEGYPESRDSDPHIGLKP